MADEMVRRLKERAAAAPDKYTRLIYEMQACLRPGVDQFLREHVLTFSGVSTAELPDVYVAAFAAIATEMIDAAVLNSPSWPKGARENLAAFCAKRFAYHLSECLQASSETVGELRRLDA